MASRSLRAKQGIVFLVFILALWGSSLGTQLNRHRQQPIDAFLVLGGSIRREIAIAQTVSEGSRLPVLISSGAQPPCTRILFERVAAPLEHVWLETCASSTFDNYRYSLSTLKQWQTQHVRVITSPTHVPRAKWLAQILLGSHGIWVEMDLVEETGVPGNTEHPIKTTLDVVRSLAWAIVSQFYTSRCPQVISLSTVNLSDWRTKGFTCERQSGITFTEERE